MTFCMRSLSPAVGCAALRVAEAVEAAQRLHRSRRSRRSGCDAPFSIVSAQRIAAARPNTTRSISEFEPRPVRAVHRNAGRFADRHQARHDVIRIAAAQRQHLAVIVRRDAAHVVMNGRQHRDRLAREIDAREHLGALRDARQALGQDLRIEMIEMQVDVVAFGADAAPFADLDRHRARDDVARCEILRMRSVALHEALALAVGEIAALAARAFGDQHARAVDAGRMELHEFHVLQRQPRAQHHGVAVAGARVRRRAREVVRP